MRRVLSCIEVYDTTTMFLGGEVTQSQQAPRITRRWSQRGEYPRYCLSRAFDCPSFGEKNSFVFSEFIFVFSD
jgi:hypothetical protein